MILPLLTTFRRLDDDTIAALQRRGEIFQWTDRDSYLAWVAAWKAELHNLIDDIRYQKSIRRNKTRSIEQRNAANKERQRLRIYACNLFLLRQAGKTLAYEQRQQRLAA